MVRHALTQMNVPSVFTTVMIMLPVSIFMVLMNVPATTDSLVMEKIVSMLMNVKLKIHVETMVFARTSRVLTAVVVTMVMPELVAPVEMLTNARLAITNVPSTLSVSIIMVHTAANASPVSQELVTLASILTNVKLVTMTVTRMLIAKILMAVTNVLALMVSWVTASVVLMLMNVQMAQPNVARMQDA